MNTLPAASAARASGCDVLAISGGAAGLTAAALLAGDVFGETPIHSPLRLFKGPHYAAFWLNFRRTLKACRMRIHNIRVADESGTAMN